MIKLKRCLAVMVAAMTLATGFNYQGLECVFAEEKSGYQIDVSYSEENNQVTLTGNVEDVPVDTILLDMTGEDGTEYEPDEFTVVVRENRTYSYILAYSVTVPETGKTVEKEETVEVVVDQIEEPEEEADQEGNASEGGSESDQETTESENPEGEENAAEDQQETSVETEPSSRSAVSVLSADSTVAPGTSTRATVGGYDFDAVKKWSTADFTNQLYYSSNTHMDNGGNPTNPYASSLKSSDTNNGAQFTFGQSLGINDRDAYWLQQGAAFSDITFDFEKDFALKGTMRVGNSFGASSDAVDDQNMVIDGGMTISFVHKDYKNQALSASRQAKGAAYRLGAYRVLPYTVVLEYDTGTDTYYE